MTTSIVRSLALVAAVLSQASCSSSLSAPDEVLVIGTLSDEPQLGLPIEMPDTVAANVPFVVTVRTMGNGCVRIGPTEVSVDGFTASVIPYDYTAAPRGSTVDCDLILKIFEHHAAIVFVTPGAATATVRALDSSGTVQDHVHEVWVE